MLRQKGREGHLLQAIEAPFSHRLQLGAGGGDVQAARHGIRKHDWLACAQSQATLKYALIRLLLLRLG